MKHYGDAIIGEVLRMVSEGMTQREIGDHYGFKDKTIVRGIIKRHNKGVRRIESGVVPVGRPRDSDAPDPGGKREIKRLRMENELLRSFLLEVGRR